jgi:hypothetical protein
VNKFRAKRTEVDGIMFASKAEAARYQTLKLELANGIISDLELQPKFPISVNGYKICTYIADFRYKLNGRTVVEDVKGMQTPVFKIKAKLLKAVHNVNIFLTK